MELHLTWFPKIRKILDEPIRFKIIRKGRRAGLTRHMAQEFVVFALERPGARMMWGDTTHSNIIRYVEIYFMPVLRQLRRIPWDWNKQEKMLRIGNSAVDFRSADRPENWEGFGYHYVFLNEAGIIFRNRYLWEVAVRPMLLDFPDSRAVIGGTPKGQNLFKELYDQVVAGDFGSDWKVYALTTYDNPTLSRDEIRQMEKEFGSDLLVRQEIYGEFVGGTERSLFTYEEIAQAQAELVDPAGQVIWGLDVARHGDDLSALAIRHGRAILEVKTLRIDDTMRLAEWLAHEYRMASPKPERIYVDVTGIGWGVYDRARQLNLPVYPADTAQASVHPNYKNKRAEMYFRFKEDHLHGGGSLPQDRDLMIELLAIEYEHEERTGKIKLVPKEKIKETLGRSPDRADAVALTYFDPVVSPHRRRIDGVAIRHRVLSRVVDPIAGY